MSAQQVLVTLKQAQTYIHQPTGLRFDHGEPRVVSSEVADHLFRFATRSVKMKSGGQITRTDIRLFEFAPVDSDEDVADAADAEESEGPAVVETLASVLSEVEPVKVNTQAPKTSAAKGAAPGGDGQARSRARGATGGQANT